MTCSSPSKVSKATLERLRLEALWPATAMGSALSSTIEFHSPQAVHFPAHCEVTLPHFWQIYVAFLGMVFCSHGLWFVFSHGYSSLRSGLRGAALAPDAPGVMSLSPKRAELLHRMAWFLFTLLTNQNLVAACLCIKQPFIYKRH